MQKRKPIHQSEMALFSECVRRVLERTLDTADIVRDGDLSPIDPAMCGGEAAGELSKEVEKLGFVRDPGALTATRISHIFHASSPEAMSVAEFPVQSAELPTARCAPAVKAF